MRDSSFHDRSNPIGPHALIKVLAGAKIKDVLVQVDDYDRVRSLTLVTASGGMVTLGPDSALKWAVFNLGGTRFTG